MIMERLHYYNFYPRYSCVYICAPFCLEGHVLQEFKWVQFSNSSSNLHQVWHSGGGCCHVYAKFEEDRVEALDLIWNRMFMVYKHFFPYFLGSTLQVIVCLYNIQHRGIAHTYNPETMLKYL